MFLETTLRRTCAGPRTVISTRRGRGPRLPTPHRCDRGAARVITRVQIGEGEAVTWGVVESGNTTLAEYDAFVWHDSTTGLNNWTKCLDETISFKAEQTKIRQCIGAAEATTRRKRGITDQSGQFSVWVG